VIAGASAAAIVLCAALVTGCGRGERAEDAGAAAPSASEGAAGVAKPDLVVDLGGGVTMEFVLVRPGAFTMGAADGFPDERPPHRVVVEKPFYLARHEATQEQWLAVMGTNPSRRRGPRNPVENVSWNDCAEFLARLNDRTPGAKFVLPSEAQWEYACRAGSTTRWCFGDDEEGLVRYTWYLADSRRTTHPVGAREPNAWGLYDMHGNVWEWCADAWHESYDGAPTDGRAWTDQGDGRRVRRGGSWYDSAWLARSAYRLGFRPDFRSENLGFRAARPAAP
jgi:formylglycine-generating enzyme required for sulfatase activity